MSADKHPREIREWKCVKCGFRWMVLQFTHVLRGNWNVCASCARDRWVSELERGGEALH